MVTQEIRLGVNYLAPDGATYSLTGQQSLRVRAGFIRYSVRKNGEAIYRTFYRTEAEMFLRVRLSGKGI